MNLHINLILVALAILSLVGCGGGKVVVNTPPALPNPPVVAAAPSPSTSTVIVRSIPSTPAQPVTIASLGPSPGPDYIHVDGYYNWLGDHYEWVAPTWVKVPYAGATYIPGHWQSSPGGYAWMPGYWR